MDVIGVHMQAIFTILLLTVVFKDNLGYRFAESTYVWAYLPGIPLPYSGLTILGRAFRNTLRRKGNGTTLSL